MDKTLRSGSMSALVMAAACLGTATAAQSYTMMPPYPTDPRNYVNKWDPFVLRAPPGTAESVLPVTNGIRTTAH